jgi:DNA-binding PadR family transcriptional regulator
MGIFKSGLTGRKDGFGLSQREASILGSLSLRPNHGYAIAKDIRENTGGKIEFTAATMYETIAQLRELGLIDRDGEETTDGGRTRKTYRITGEGEVALREYLSLLQQTLPRALGLQGGA